MEEADPRYAEIVHTQRNDNYMEGKEEADPRYADIAHAQRNNMEEVDQRYAEIAHTQRKLIIVSWKKQRKLI